MANQKEPLDVNDFVPPAVARLKPREAYLLGWANRARWVGMQTSPRRAAASRRNAKKGGRRHGTRLYCYAVQTGKLSPPQAARVFAHDKEHSYTVLARKLGISREAALNYPRVSRDQARELAPVVFEYD